MQRKRLHHSPVHSMTEEAKEHAVNQACGNIVEMFQHPEQLPQALAPAFLKLGTWMSKWSIRNQLIAYFYKSEDAMTIYNWERYAGRKPLEKFTEQQEALNYIPGGFFILKPFKVPIWMTVKVKNKETGEEEPKRVKRQKIIGYIPHYVYPKHNTEIVNADLAAKWDKRNEEAQRVVEEMPFIDMLRDKGVEFRVEDTGSYGILGYYSATDQIIALGVSNMATALHEVGHHYDKECGNLTEGMGQDPGNEIVAEMFGAILLTMMGYNHDADLGGAWGYVKRYAKEKSGDTTSTAILGSVSDLLWRVKAALMAFFQDVEDYEKRAA